ncbi:MAG: UvrD-helicase domain-containing protein, partial [Oscillospiraceae bacterium]|nr:UvrD-helicase domain-containing protein [Oscillospiraceae bacterium]
QQTAWGRAALLQAQELLAEARAIAVQQLELLHEDEALTRSAEHVLLSDSDTVLSLSAKVNAGDWDGAAHMLQNVSWARLSWRGGDAALKEEIKALREMLKGLIKKLQEGALGFTAAEAKAAAARTLPIAEALFTVCDVYRQKQMEYKLERRFFEFDDLETLTLRLLCNENGEPGEQAKEIAAGFDCIFVDEFQDTNERQKCIFDAVSQDGKNLFCVGDVKQSIYRFRRADPTIFTDMRDECYPAEAGLYPAYLALHKNFRSSAPVLDAVNRIFMPLMTQRFGGVNYGEGEQLEKGAIEGEVQVDDPVGLELHLLQEEKELLPQAVAGYIADMLQSGAPVADKGRLRPCKEEDFCILLRTMKGIAPEYLKALQAQGIRCSAASEENYFDTAEIMTAMSLLRIIDNPRRDVDLLAVMLSPLFGFLPDDVAKLRLAGKKQSLWAQLLQSEDARCAAFVEKIKALRAAAACLTTEELVERALAETEAELLLTAPPDTELRRARLRALIGYAAQYSSYGGKGLSDFIRHCESTAQRGKGPVVAAAAGSGVQICSVHRAKGLEWPIVILADAAHGFNKQDTHSSTVLTDAKLGLGARLRSETQDGIWVQKTPAYRAISQELDRAGTEEVLRVLYVALTRARQKVAVFADVQATKEGEGGEVLFLHAERSFCGGKLLQGAPARAGSFAQWLAMAYVEAGFRAGDAVNGHAERGSLALFCGDISRYETGRTQAAEAKQDGAAAALAKTIDAQLAFRYAYEPLTRVPTKIAVTEHTGTEETPFISLPAFSRGGTLSAAEKGTALHNFMQLCSYEAAAKDPAAEIARLRDGQYLDEAAANSISAEAVKGFFQSELGKRVLAAPKVLREYAFIDSVAAGELMELSGEFASQQVLVQGIADCVLVEEDGAVLIDYKTDRVTAADELRQRYSAQLAFYRRSIERRLGMPVKECLLWSFKLNEAVPL